MSKPAAAAVNAPDHTPLMKQQWRMMEINDLNH